MTDTPIAAATIAESITDTNHGIARVGFAPTLSVVATGDGAGTGATGVIAGTCDRHRIIITTGSGPSDGKQATVSYPGGSLFAKEPIVSLIPVNAAAHAKNQYIDLRHTENLDAYEIWLVAGSLDDETTYVWVGSVSSAEDEI
jgi:hypothetical protein